MTNYIEVNGTHYDEDTPRGLIEALEQVRDTKDMVTIHYGDQMTGEDWESLYDPHWLCGQRHRRIKEPAFERVH